MTSAALSMPVMHVPFPATRHPDLERIEADAMTWAAERLDPVSLDRVKKTLVGTYVAYTAGPDCARALLDAYAHFLVWGFWFDDLFVDDVEPDAPEHTAAIASVLAVLDTRHGTGAAGEAIERALTEVMDELEAVLTHSQMSRWRQEMHIWFCAMAFQNAMRKQTPTVEGYKALRRCSVAIYPCLPLVEASHKARIPSSDPHHPTIEELRVHCANQVAWANDVFSYHLEQGHPGGFWNLPTVYQAHGLTAQEAINQAAADANAEALAFARKQTAGHHQLTSAQQLCIDAMRSCMRGVLDWQRTATDRYTGWTNPAQ